MVVFSPYNIVCRQKILKHKSQWKQQIQINRSLFIIYAQHLT